MFKEMKTSELTGAALDWAVAKCEGGWLIEITSFTAHHSLERMRFCSDWTQAGPIIEREGIGATVVSERCDNEKWLGANFKGTFVEYGPTCLVACMRTYVASRLGDTVSIPVELL